MTWHRFSRLGDLSPKQRRVQRLGVFAEAVQAQ
jgi:hypothetical protein